MTIKTKQLLLSCLLTVSLIACNNETKEETNDETKATSVQIKEEAVSYTADTITANGFVVYDENKEGKRPAVLVVHEWWGLGEYARSRAKQLAELGYIAMAVDMYGNGRTAEDPGGAQTLATPFYMNPQLAKTRLDAAITKLKTYAQTDTSKMAAIGYCFGGFIVLNAAKLGADLKGVVSFHGNLLGAPVNKDLLKANVLVCHGEADNFVPPAEVNAFKKSMDSISASYTFKSYPNAVHAFTNPQATETGKKFNMPVAYNASADSTSWNDMKTFFAKIF